tara:strand:- start:5321 stop:5830 length:510 start_codon:yes stop_codon:yes gene_type:complete
MASILNVDQIGHSTSGNTALTVDSSGNVSASGRVTTPARPAFRVTGVLNGWADLVSNTKVSLLTTVDYNIGSHYSTTNYEFIAPCDGLFHFSGRFYVNNTATISDYFISIDDSSLDGTLYFASQDNDQSDSSVTFAETFQLTANQTVSIKGNAGQYYPLYSSFSGFLVG